MKTICPDIYLPLLLILDGVFRFESFLLAHLRVFKLNQKDGYFFIFKETGVRYLWQGALPPKPIGLNSFLLLCESGQVRIT